MYICEIFIYTHTDTYFFMHVCVFMCMYICVYVYTYHIFNQMRCETCHDQSFEYLLLGDHLLVAVLSGT